MMLNTQRDGGDCQLLSHISVRDVVQLIKQCHGRLKAMVDASNGGENNLYDLDIQYGVTN